MNTRIKLIALLVILTTGFGFWVYSQTSTAQTNTAGLPIAFCNPNKILKSYRKTMSMRQELIDEQGRMMKKIEDTKKQVKDKADDLAVSGFAPGSPEYRKMRKDLVEMSMQNEIFLYSEDDWQ